MPTEQPPSSKSPLRWWQGYELLLVLPPLLILWVQPVVVRWFFMWTLAFAIYCGCKWLTWRRTPRPEASLWKHLGYLMAWPGMNADSFLSGNTKRPPAKPRLPEWLLAYATFLLGLALLYGAARWIPSQYPYLTGWIGMVSLVLILHFGLFRILSCFWRTLGVNAPPLMDSPLTAVSVTEFWGKRWNTAFRELTHRFVFRPLSARFHARPALLLGFLLSGLIHELVITIPARGGYGGPTLFFLVQGGAVFLERSPSGRKIGLGSGWRGWLFTMLTLLLPVYLMLEPPFVVGVIVPFMKAIRAL